MCVALWRDCLVAPTCLLAMLDTDAATWGSPGRRCCHLSAALLRALRTARPPRGHRALTSQSTAC